MDDITWVFVKVSIVLFMKYWLAVLPWQVNGWLESQRRAGAVSWRRLLASFALLLPHSLLFLMQLGAFGYFLW